MERKSYQLQQQAYLKFIVFLKSIKLQDSQFLSLTFKNKLNQDLNSGPQVEVINVSITDKLYYKPFSSRFWKTFLTTNNLAFNTIFLLSQLLCNIVLVALMNTASYFVSFTVEYHRLQSFYLLRLVSFCFHTTSSSSHLKSNLNVQ